MPFRFHLHTNSIIVIPDHKSNLCPFFEIEIYTSIQRGLDKLLIDVQFVGIGQYLGDTKLFNYI